MRVEELLSGDRRVLARAITWVEDGDIRGRDLLAGLAGRVGHALRVGVTGPPGVGKSTLIDALARHVGGEGQRVRVLAVDPSSPFTGGAFLGDRIRMGRSAENTSIYIRSMATRGASGGLARATFDVLDVMDAAGSDVLLLETVGAGQAELEVARCSDVVLVLVSPESGDGIQAMKSGLMEVADIVVINKADRPGADRLEVEMRSAFELSTRRSKSLPILRTEAHAGKGVEELWNAIGAFVAEQRQGGSFEGRRRDHLRGRLRRVAETLLSEKLWNGAQPRLESLAAEVSEGRLSTYAAAEELVRSILEKPS